MVIHKKTAKRGEAGDAVPATGARALMKFIIGQGVDLVFGYPGGAIMPVYDALYFFRDKIRHIQVRHEQGAVHAAQGYARVTGRTGVCFVTSGPGATNIVTGIADAKADSTPVVVISGQVPSAMLGNEAFQETDIISITKPIAKWNFQVTRPEEIPGAIAEGFRIARSGRPGPVLIDITKDAQSGSFRFENKFFDRSPKINYSSLVDPLQVEEAVRLINLSVKPMFLVGQGVRLARAEKALLGFIEKTGIPAAETLLGLSTLPSNHPLNVGLVGMHGNYGPNVKTNECDLIIAAGMRFDDRVTSDVSSYAKKAKIVHLEIEPSQINKRVYADAPVLGDIKDSLPILTSMVHENDHSEWLEEFRACYRLEYERVIEKEVFPAEGPVTMGEVVRHVSSSFTEDAVMVTDVGQHQMIAWRYFGFRKPGSVVTSGGLGTMGFGLPAAIGAKIGKPCRPVVLFAGDGGFQMTLQELATLSQYKVPVKMVLINNNFLGMVRQWQEMFYEKRYSSTLMSNPDFQSIAPGYGIPSEKVVCRSELDGAVKRMAESSGPYLLEVAVEKEQNVFPMVPPGGSVEDIRLE